MSIVFFQKIDELFKILFEFHFIYSKHIIKAAI